MKRPLTDHEYQINGGEWIGCTTSNCTDHSDGTYTITDGLDIDIPIGQLKVRVKALDVNPASAELLNSVAFNASIIRKYQILYIGDSITGGIGTTGTGVASSGDFNKGNDYPTKTTEALVNSGLTVDQSVMPFPGQTAAWFNTNALNDAIQLFDYINYTDIYCVLFFGANDLLDTNATDFQINLTTTCTALKAAGAKVVIVPVLDRNDSFSNVNFHIRRTTFNSWLASNGLTIADAIVDVSEHPEMWADDACSNTIYFNRPDSDGLSGVHPTDVGVDIIATCLANTIATLAATPPLINTPPDEAATFIAATGITDSTIVAAINTMVADLKTAGLWWKLRAIYPFVGGTDETHKYNLRDARDLDIAYRMTFTESPVHNTDGVFWASGAKGDTKFTQNVGSKFTYGKLSMHYYSRTALATPAGIDMGATEKVRLAINFGGNCYAEVNNVASAGFAVSYNNLGLYTTTRTNSLTKRSLYRNGVLIADIISGDTMEGQQDQSMLLGGERFTGVNEYPSARNCAYAAIGYGLTTDEEAAHYSIVQALQATLGRAV